MRDFALILKFAGATFFSVSIVGGIAGLFGWVATLEGEALPLMDGPMTVVGLTIGALIYGAGYWMEKKIKPKVSPTVVLDPENMGFVYETLRKHRNSMLGLCIFMSVFGGGLLLAVLLMPYEEGSTIPMVVMTLLSMACLFAGGKGFIAYSKIKDIRRSEVYNVIMNEPGSITDLIASFIKKSGAPGTVGQRISLAIMQQKKKLATITISETNLELLRQHVMVKNPAVKFEKKNVEI